MNQRHLCNSLVIALPLLLAASLHAAAVTNLRCEYRDNPLGIDVVKPRFSWVNEDRDPRSEVRGIKQTAYQVLVASSEELLEQDMGDLWDSGRVESDKSIQVEYAGKPLTSRMQCHWKVRVWTLTADLRSPVSSSWSALARWTMGLLDSKDWQAKWIGVKQPALAPAGRTPLEPGPLRIVRASYQPISGAAGRDVTELLASRVQDGTLLLTVGNNELGGDPAPGRREGEKLTMEVTIPPNTTATVYVPVASKPGEDKPAKDAAAVTEGGNTIDKVKGVKFLRMENIAAVYAVGSGTYRFGSSLADTVK